MKINRFSMNKGVIVILVVISILFVVYFLYSRLVFNGGFDKKYSREELVKNFIHNEKSFFDLVEYFNSINPKEEGQTVSFGLGKKNTVKLYIYPTVIDPDNKILGRDDLTLDSKELDSVLIKLRWTNENVRTLRDKLLATKCDWIRTTEVYGNPIQIYPRQDGWGSYSYYIFDAPASDELIRIHGKPIGESGFGKRAFLEYSSAL